MADPVLNSAELEDLSVLLKGLVIQVREGVHDRSLYSKLYWARHRLGIVVSRYGCGMPPKPRLESNDEAATPKG